MTQPEDAGNPPSPSSALLQLARLKAALTQRELAERASVGVSIISAYEREQLQVWRKAVPADGSPRTLPGCTGT